MRFARDSVRNLKLTYTELSWNFGTAVKYPFCLSTLDVDARGSESNYTTCHLQLECKIIILKFFTRPLFHVHTPGTVMSNGPSSGGYLAIITPITEGPPNTLREYCNTFRKQANRCPFRRLCSVKVRSTLDHQKGFMA